MKKTITTGLLSAILLFTFAFSGAAQSTDPVTMFKQHINHVVQRVQAEENPEAKRQIMNDSFNDLRTSFDRVQSMTAGSPADQQAIAALKQNIAEKQNELNGTEGFARVEDSQLNNFAQFVQQDLEQADSTITISVTVLLLIIIILLLL